MENQGYKLIIKSMVQAAQPDALCMKVELFISGRRLKDLDAFSKSDP